MKSQDFTTSFSVDQTPEEVFRAIQNVRAWWSHQIDGDTGQLGSVLAYRYQDVHRCKLKITELVPNEKVVWHVVENHFDFTEDEAEWTGTDIRFEISRTGAKTTLRFTHVGLVPAYECFDICSSAWGTYIDGSLRSLIVTGVGQPNQNEEIEKKFLTSDAPPTSGADYTTRFTVSQTPQQVFDAIRNVRGWWTGDVHGVTDELGGEFTYRYEKLHYSKQKITELVPGKKVAWLVVDAELGFVDDRSEWRDTTITFEIQPKGKRTEVVFTHAGLKPERECYGACSSAWRSYVNGSLRKLITAS